MDKRVAKVSGGVVGQAAAPSRRECGTSGRRIPLLSNHFRVSVNQPDQIFYQYAVAFTYEDKTPVESKGLGRQLINKLCQTYASDLDGNRLAYDGEHTLYTIRQLARSAMDFTVLLEDTYGKRGNNGSPAARDDNDDEGNSGKRSKHCFRSKLVNVNINYVAQIPFKSVALALKGNNAVENTQDTLRVLDIVLRQQAANRGCLLVKQSFFRDDARNMVDLGGGVMGCRGFHSSFRVTQGGLSLNMDVSTTMVLKPGPVIDFLIVNQNARSPEQIDWGKAKRMLKSLRIKTTHANREYKIKGLSDRPCNQLYFPMKVRTGDNEQSVDVTVYDYFLKHHGIPLRHSANYPCLDVGKPKKPNYVPLELATLVSLQRYTKALSTMQRASLVEKSRQKPQERMRTVTDAVRSNCYDKDPLLAACGVKIDTNLVQLEGRVLEAPKLKVGNKEDCVPRNGRWNFNNKKFYDPARIDRWIVVNFSARCDFKRLPGELISSARNKGVHIEPPMLCIEEDRRDSRHGPAERVARMFEQIVRHKLPVAPQFVLCVLPERKTCDIYGPWKKRCLCDLGVVNQCISPSKINDQYLTNVLLKINTKLDGVNSLLAIEDSSRIPIVKDVPTMILGMDVSHGSPGRSDAPSIAAVVGSRSWPLISRYRAAVRTQSPKVEMIDSLFKPLANGEDDGIMKELLIDFYKTSNGKKPKQIILFRDGVSESQFNQVLNIEVEQIKKAYMNLGEKDPPRFTVIVAQKNHHTKLFQANGPENVPPGTVVDTQIVSPTSNDFYMCAQAGMIGTSRPTHYHVLVDEIGFAPDALQQLIHSLSYVYQRSTSAISIVAPIAYAHHAAAQVGQFMKVEDSSSSSDNASVTVPGTLPVPELPRLDKKVAGSMFFC